MHKKYPDWTFTQTYAANDLIWNYLNFIVSKIEHRNCLVIDYDDMSIAICKEHLLEYVSQL